MADLEVVNADIRAAGGWVFAGGLADQGSATTIRTSGGVTDAVLTDGPFVEAKEHLGGLSIVRSGDYDVVLGWAERIAKATGTARRGAPVPGRGRARPGADRPLTAPSAMAVTSADIARVFRAEHGRAVSVLIRALGDIDLAEDAVQDAFTVAVERWPRDGMPPSPAGWIITTARRRAIDRLRREATRDARHAEALVVHAADEHPDALEEGPVQDERLRLVFTCCHPALSRRRRWR